MSQHHVFYFVTHIKKLNVSVQFIFQLTYYNYPFVEAAYSYVPSFRGYKQQHDIRAVILASFQLRPFTSFVVVPRVFRLATYIYFISLGSTQSVSYFTLG